MFHTRSVVDRFAFLSERFPALLERRAVYVVLALCHHEVVLLLERSVVSRRVKTEVVCLRPYRLLLREVGPV